MEDIDWREEFTLEHLKFRTQMIRKEKKKFFHTNTSNYCNKTKTVPYILLATSLFIKQTHLNNTSFQFTQAYTDK